LLLVFAPPGWAQTPGQGQTITRPAPPLPGAQTAGQTPGQLARDPTKATAEDVKPATIRGRIVALDTGRPLRRVQVRVSGEKVRRSIAAVTDPDGRYEVRNLAPGRYTIWVQKGGYVPVSYGQRGPHDPGRPVEVAAGQTLDRVDMRLPRGSVITGRVVDELGEPMSNVMISVLQYRRIGGKRQLMQTGGGNSTNDIGQYRVFGLPPGAYYVAASNQGGMGFEDVDPSQEASDYEPTFYPGTPDPAAAQPVNVTIGEEAVADIQLTPTRVHSVSGVAVDSAGKPITGGWVSLMRKGAMLRGDMRGGTALDGEGSFSVHGLSAGTYILQVNEAGRMGGPRAPDQDFEVARLTVTVAGEDITGLRLAGTKGGVLRGRVVFEGGLPPTDTPRGSISCYPVDEEMAMGGMRMSGSSFAEAAKGDLSWELKNVFGPCVITSYVQGWMLKAVRAGGADLLEQPIDVPPQKPITDIELVFTNRLTTVMGSVAGADGAAVKDYAIIIFPEDETKWEQSRGMASRVRVARADQDGTFKFRSLPPGDYLAVALENVDTTEDQDPEVLERLRPLATPARVTEGGTVTLTMKLSTRPPP
jgi:protocatechuate 3,4-dioxygenase beta subunit